MIVYLPKVLKMKQGDKGGELKAQWHKGTRAQWHKGTRAQGLKRVIVEMFYEEISV